MTQNELANYLISNIPGGRLVSGGKEVLVRCPRCGDSLDPRSAHFYIGLGDENTPPMYHCKKCNEGGIFDFSKLRWFEIYDPEFGKQLNQKVDSIITNSANGNRINTFKGVFNICNTKVTWNDKIKAKLDYINSRLGLNLTAEEALNKKIVLNIGDLLQENNIFNYTRSHYIMNQLDDGFIGFLSYDNGFLNMRNVNILSNPFTDKRYINYNIFNKVDNSKRYYILPTAIDVTKKISIRIAEGPFDILGVYYNVVNESNNIYAAIGGKSYLNIIKFFIEEMGIVYFDLHMYVDRDVDNNFIFRIRNYLSPFNIQIYMHRNEFGNEKDYGVPRSRIYDKVNLISSL